MELGGSAPRAVERLATVCKGNPDGRFGCMFVPARPMAVRWGGEVNVGECRRKSEIVYLQ